MNYPQLIDFGLCPVAEVTYVTFDVANPTGNDTTVELIVPDYCKTVTIEPRVATIAGGKLKTFRASFLPTEAMVLDCPVKLLFGNKEASIPFKGFGKYPYLSASSTVINFDEV